MKLRIVAMSDMHGLLPDPTELPKCDLLLIGGDICPTLNHRINYQEAWLDAEFRRWLHLVPADAVVGVAGNHDFIFQLNPYRVPKLPWTYLQDSGLNYKGLRIWGTPWTPTFGDWAFGLPDVNPQGVGLHVPYDQIPEGTDVVICHGPPFGFGDQTISGENVGSRTLLSRLDVVKPKLVVFGHIHEGQGVYLTDGMTLANVTLLNIYYKRAHDPYVTEIEVPDQEEACAPPIPNTTT